NTRGISLDTSKTFHFLGNQHTLSVGYTWQLPIYNDITSYTGPKFALPQLNAANGDPGYDNATNPTVVGKMSDAALSLLLASNVSNSSSCSLFPFHERARLQYSTTGCTAPVARPVRRGRYAEYRKISLRLR